MRQPGHLDREGPAVKAPASIPATARWWGAQAQASMSSRLMPALRAVFHPTEMVMQRVGRPASPGGSG